MQIFYTHDIFSKQKIGGISRYYVELARTLSRRGSDVRVLAGRHANLHLSELEGHDCLEGTFSREKPQAPFFFRSSVSGPPASSPRTIVHHTYYSFRRPVRHTRVVITIHDLIPERLPASFGWKARLLSAAKKRSCQFADRILTISQTTKRDLVEAYGISPDRIDVTYLGNSLLRFRGQELSSPESQPFLLYVGNRAGYKNCDVLFQAFAKSSFLQKDFGIVCFGGGPFSYAETRRIRELGIEKHVRQIAGDDRELASCYRHAAAFVCPSLYEGFGIPLVEAMSFGCPIAVANAGSLPEVAGQAAVYFDPTEPEELQAVLEELLFDNDEMERLREQMAIRERQFRWEKTAEETLRCYERVAA